MGAMSARDCQSYVRSLDAADAAVCCLSWSALAGPPPADGLRSQRSGRKARRSGPQERGSWCRLAMSTSQMVSGGIATSLPSMWSGTNRDAVHRGTAGTGP